MDTRSELFYMIQKEFPNIKHSHIDRYLNKSKGYFHTLYKYARRHKRPFQCLSRAEIIFSFVSLYPDTAERLEELDEILHTEKGYCRKLFKQELRKRLKKNDDKKTT